MLGKVSTLDLLSVVKLLMVELLKLTFLLNVLLRLLGETVNDPRPLSMLAN